MKESCRTFLNIARNITKLMVRESDKLRDNREMEAHFDMEMRLTLAGQLIDSFYNERTQLLGHQMLSQICQYASMGTDISQALEASEWIFIDESALKRQDEIHLDPDNPFNAPGSSEY